MEQLKGYIRPPFANYDVVVYFGGGLFFLPFLHRYVLEPLQVRLPSFVVPMGKPFLSDAVFTLTTLFSIYIVGHFLAYLGSQFVEKFVDRVFGKVSTAIFVSSRTNEAERDEWIRAVIYDRLRRIRRDKSILATIVRSLAHLPALPLYIAVFVLGIFGYYDTRVPKDVMRTAAHKFRNAEPFSTRIGMKTKWFKALEYYVINRNPAANARMYNYLVISGLFRTMALVFLFSLWMQMYYGIHNLVDGDWMLEPLMSMPWKHIGIIEYMLIAAAYTFSLFAYLKFQRRYAEEAIFAFVFESTSALGESATRGPDARLR